MCYPGAPLWLNRFFASLQWAAVTRNLSGLPLRGVRALDVGCGFGRWTRWLAERGAECTGVDPTAGMLEAARTVSGPAVEYRQMSATALDYPDEHFDLATCITVIQHLTPEEQVAAVAELARVVRPGGRAIVLDLIDLDDSGDIVYPRSPSEWIGIYESNGLAVSRWEGQEFVPLIRGFRWLAERVGAIVGLGSSEQRDGQSLLEKTQGRGAYKVAYAGLWTLVQLSKPLEPLCRWTLPGRWARHACFVFRKDAA